MMKGHGQRVGFRLLGMNMSDGETGKLVWDSGSDDLQQMKVLLLWFFFILTKGNCRKSTFQEKFCVVKLFLVSSHLGRTRR